MFFSQLFNSIINWLEIDLVFAYVCVCDPLLIRLIHFFLWIFDWFFFILYFFSMSEITLWNWVTLLVSFFFFAFFGHDKFLISFSNLFVRIGYIHWLIRNDKRYEEIDRIFVPLLQECTVLKTPLMTKILAIISLQDSHNGISFIDRFLRYLY